MRKNNEQVRVNQRGSQSSQSIVIAEFNFIHCHGIVFVDDRDDAARQQRINCIPGCQMSVPGFQIVVSQQNLGNVQAKFSEGLIVNGHQFSLTDRGRRLQCWQILWPFGEPKRRHAGGDGSRTDECNLPALSLQRCDRSGEAFDRR